MEEPRRRPAAPEPAAAAPEPAPAEEEEEVAKEKITSFLEGMADESSKKVISDKRRKEIEQEVRDKIMREATSATAEEEVSDVIRKPMNRVSVKRQKEIEKEVRDKLDLEAPRAISSTSFVPSASRSSRPSASTSTASTSSAPSASTSTAEPAPAPERKPPKQTDILDPTPVTSVDLIPDARRSAEFKTAKQLRDDIEFFFESFPEMLEKEMRQYIKLPKTKKTELARFHRMIMGKLQPSASISPEQKKVGVVISADEYIKQAINKALIDAKMLSMSPADVVELSVKGVDKKDNSESFGPYEVKKSKSGKLAAQREPIYRYVPQVNEEAEAEPPRSMLRVKKRESLPQTAKRKVRSNPFLRRETNTVRLKYLY